MSTVGLGFITPSFKTYDDYAVGGTELFASALLIFPATRRIGAAIGFVVIYGAIFFHLGTLLGVDRREGESIAGREVDRTINAAGDTDNGVLFFMACGVWLSCLLIFILSKNKS